MKKLISILIMLCMLLAAPAGVFAQEPMIGGTTPSNLMIGGSVACDGQNVYFAVGATIYRTPLAGGAKAAVVQPGDYGRPGWSPAQQDIAPSYLSLDGGSLFFYIGEWQGTKNGIYRHDLSTGKTVRVLDTGTLTPYDFSYLCAQDGWLTYALGDGGGRTVFYRMREDGTQNAASGAILDQNSWELFVADGWVYSSDCHSGDAEHTHRPYRVRLDGSGKAQVISDYVDFEYGLAYSGGRFYFGKTPVTRYPDGSVALGGVESYYSAMPDGTDQKKMALPGSSQGSAVKFCVADGWIYYLSGYSENTITLRKVRTDGGGGVVLGTFDIPSLERFDEFYTVPGWIYFTALIYGNNKQPLADNPFPGTTQYRLDQAMYRVRADGTGLERLDVRPGVSVLTVSY